MARLEIVSRTVAKEREARKVNALPVELMQIAGNKKTKFHRSGVMLPSAKRGTFCSFFPSNQSFNSVL